MATLTVTMKRLLDFVSTEVTELAMPGVMNPDQRFEQILPVYDQVKKLFQYGKKTYGMDRIMWDQWDRMEHWVAMLHRMYPQPERVKD